MMRKISKIIIFYLLLLVLGLNCQKSKNPISSITEEGSWEIISDINEGLNAIFFIDSINGWAVGDSGTIKHTHGGGITWTNQNSKTNDRLISVHFMDQDKGFASGYNQTLIHTDDGGNTWENDAVQSDSTTIYESLHSDNSNNIYFISNYGEIFYSPDMGQTWDCKYTFNDWGYSYLYYPNSTTGFAMRLIGSELQKTIDGGLNWIPYQLPSSWMRDIFFLDEHYGWLTENGALNATVHDSSSIYFTYNGGKNWNLLSKLSGVILDNIVFTDVRHGWMARSTEIYHTNNGGKSWVCQFDLEDIGFIKDMFFLNNMCGWALTSHGKIIKYSVH